MVKIVMSPCSRMTKIVPPEFFEWEKLSFEHCSGIAECNREFAKHLNTRGIRWASGLSSVKKLKRDRMLMAASRSRRRKKIYSITVVFVLALLGFIYFVNREAFLLIMALPIMVLLDGFRRMNSRMSFLSAQDKAEPGPSRAVVAP